MGKPWAFTREYVTNPWHAWALRLGLLATVVYAVECHCQISLAVSDPNQTSKWIWWQMLIDDHANPTPIQNCTPVQATGWAFFELQVNKFPPMGSKNAPFLTYNWITVRMRRFRPQRIGAAYRGPAGSNWLYLYRRCPLSPHYHSLPAMLHVPISHSGTDSPYGWKEFQLWKCGLIISSNWSIPANTVDHCSLSGCGWYLGRYHDCIWSPHI